MDCIFCKIVAGEIPSRKLYEDDKVIVIMDVNPIVDGHVLLIPKKHYTDYMEMDSDITSHIFEIAKKMGKKIIKNLDVKSITLLVNYGDDQQVKHYHLHILPELGTTKISRSTRSIEDNYNLINKD